MLKNKKQDMKPYDMGRPPCKQNPFLLPVIWGLSYILTRAGGLKIKKVGMKGLKAPFLLLSFHQGFTDYYIAPLVLFPHRANYVSDVEGFAAFGNALYRQAGCIPKRRFVQDATLIRNICHAVQNKSIVVLFPEARHSNIGTNSRLPDAVAKLVKLLNIPVVVLKINGSYLTAPVWDERRCRKVPIYARLEKVLAPEDIQKLTEEEITTLINQHFQYDEYRWQQKAQISIKEAKRAEGLHKVLYLCPSCKTEYAIESKNASLYCTQCKKQWFVDEKGKITALSGKAEFDHLPDWYAFQWENVKSQIDHNTYAFKSAVRIEALPNEKGFVSLGIGMLEHNCDGFILTGKQLPGILRFQSASLFSLHTEYDYKGKGSCIVLSKRNCCYYLYPMIKQYNITKLQFATEIYYDLAHHSKVSPEISMR